MRRFNECVFDDMVYGTATVYTGAQFAEILGSTDQRTIQVIGSDLARNTTQVTVQIQQSPDGMRWLPKNATPEIDHANLPQGQITSATGADAGTAAGDGLARLAISLSDPGGAPSAALRIYVTGRDRAKLDEGHCACSPLDDADEPTDELAYGELVQIAIASLLSAGDSLLSPEVELELEWVRALLDDLPPDEREAAVLEELGDVARADLEDAMNGVRAEMEGQRLTLVRGGKARVGELPPRVDPRAFWARLHHDLQHDWPNLSLSRQHLEHMRAAIAEAPPGQAAAAAVRALIMNSPECAEDVLRLLENTMDSLGGAIR